MIDEQFFVDDEIDPWEHLERPGAKSLGRLRANQPVFIASPYSHPVRAVRELRCQLNDFAAMALFRQGIACYSPIAHWHRIEQGHMADHLQYEEYAHQSRVMIARCQSVLVLDIPGVDESKGVGDETKEARTLLLPVIYAPLELLHEWYTTAPTSSEPASLGRVVF